jgi:peptidoglycan/LPS O-acetylase OafA/YrhL
LDGLRGVAVAVVVAYHLGFLRGGFVGVDLFFVLSGFLITSLLLADTPSSPAELRAWWGKRIRRLTPAVAVVVVAVLVAFAAIGAAGASLDMDAVATLTWWQNWHLILGEVPYWSPDASPLRHAWSLSIEEQFYLLWPVVLLATVVAARRRRWHPALAVAMVAGIGAGASFAWAATLATRPDADLSRIYFGTDTRAGALLLGCAAAAIVHERPTPTIRHRGTIAAIGAAAVLAVLTVTLDPASVTTYRWGLALAAAASLVLVIAASFPGPVESALSPRPLHWLGVRSYAIYLWSWPVQLLVEELRPEAPRVLVAAVTVGATLALADLSLRFVEGPLRLRKGWAARLRPRQSAWLGGGVAIVAAMAFVALAAEPPTGIAAVSTEESAEMALRPPPTTAAPIGAAPTTAETTTAAPVQGDGTAPAAPESEVLAATTPSPADAPASSTAQRPPRLRLVVIGDSLAFSSTFISGPAQLNPAGIEVADGRGLIGCWLLSADGWSAYEKSTLKRPHPLCAQQREAEALGLSARPDWVVDFAGGWEGTTFVDPAGVTHEPLAPEVRAAILGELIQRGQEAAAAGARMAWPAWVCPGSESWLWFAPGYAGWFNDILREAAANVPGSVVIEPTDRVCEGGDANGRPTAEKDAAWGHEHHPHDGAWLWQVWLGPALWAAEGRPNPG